MSDTFLLCIEGVNFASVFYDTNQLSVQRGASMLLKNATNELLDPLNLVKFGVVPPIKIELISGGASIGIYKLTFCSQELAERIKHKITDHFLKDEKFKHFTFVVDIEPLKSETDFSRCMAAARAKNKYRQFRQLTVAMPQINGGSENGPCAWDNLRPCSAINNTTVIRDDGVVVPKVSESALVRHDFGRNAKSAFIEGKTELAIASQTLHEIASNPNYKNLNNKIAVIYADGNSFSSIVRGAKSMEEVQKTDKLMQTFRNEFLTALIGEKSHDKEFLLLPNSSKKQSKGKLRLEILIWGADEFTLVVPAWKGFEVMHYFFEKSKHWKIDNHALTHTGALVFCNVKTPLAKAIDTAKELAECAKGQPDGRKKNHFDYAIFEAIDYPTQDVAHYKRHRYGEECANQMRTLHPVSNWNEFSQSTIQPMIDENIASENDLQNRANNRARPLPRRQAIMLAMAAQTGDAAFHGAKERLEMLYGQADVNRWTAQLSNIFSPVNDEKLLWLHMAECWDYLAPTPQN